MESALLWFSVVATVYGGPGSVYDGQPLYCAGADGPYYTETTAPWVAVDVRVLNNGRTRCGDMLSIRFDNGMELIAQAMDAGPFKGYSVRDWPDRPIAVDIPRHLWPRKGLSAMVDVVNLSALDRVDRTLLLHPIRVDPGRQGGLVM